MGSFLNLDVAKDIGFVAFLQPMLVHSFEQQAQGLLPQNSYQASISLLKKMLPFFPIKMAMIDLEGELISATSLWENDPLTKLISKDMKICFNHNSTLPFHETLSKHIHTVLNGEIIKDNCMEWKTSDGSLRWLKIEMQPWMSSKISVGGILVFIEDLTALKKQETQLMDLECFAYMCPHDLKASVRILNSFLTLLNEYRGARKDEIEKEYFEFLFEALRTCNEIIENSLQSLAPNDLKMDVKIINLKDVVDSVLHSIQPLIHEKRADITVKDLSFIKADFVLMKRIVLNLITNSLKFSESPRIEIYGTTNLDYITFCVQDNGMGISSEMHSKIFETYSRDETIDISSTGLGLSYCRKVLKLWGGEIFVQSELGNGALFTLKFPKPS